MRRNGIARLCTYAAFAVTVAATLAGCSGGLSSADNGPGASASVPPPTTPATGPTTPAGIALQKAALAAPATTSTAATPSQAFGLVAGAGLPVVTVNSPPVVNFTVIDSSGRPVTGLTLFNPKGAAADPNCSGNNATFAIAKWATAADGQGAWQNLISRQRYATTDVSAKHYSVAEGATDPKPTASLSNPATVAMTVDPATGKASVSDQANQIVGILKENASEGYYTYTFGMDVTTALLFADAVDKKNISLGKVANNGNVAVKDGKTIHRVGMQLCYTDPVTKAKVVVNPYVDFTLAADGSATPVTVSSTDKTLKPYRQVVDRASCNDCHADLRAHGTRVDPNYCVICHNPGSTDYNTNNPIDFKLMIHRFHYGVNLTNDYSVVRFAAKATDPTTGAVTGVHFPQNILNCVKCHGGPTSAARHPTPDGDNWMNRPSRNACGACHDGINFATGGGTGTGTTTALTGVAKAKAVGHGGGIMGDDGACTYCHTGAYVASKHALPSVADASQRKMSANITAAAVDATSGKVTVSFTMTKNGAAVTGGTADFTLSEWTLAKLVSPGNGAPSHWQSYTGRFRTKDKAKPLVPQGYSEAGTLGTLTNLGGGKYTYTFALENATTPGDIRTITGAKDKSSTTGAMAGYVPVAGLIPNPAGVDTSYNADATHRVGLLFNETAKDATNAVFKNNDNATFDFVPSGKTAPTRNIIDMTTCRDGCHSGRLLHKGYNTNVCVTCHTETTFDPFTGGNPVTVDLKYMVHRIHMGETLPGNVQGIAIGGDPAVAPASYGINDFDTSEVAFPQPVSNCLACHLPATTLGKSEATNWKAVPSRLACGSCHDGINFATGGGSTVKESAAYATALASYNTALAAYNTAIAAGKTATKPTAPTLASSGHSGGAQFDDSRCAKCHDAGSTVLYHVN